MYTFESRGRILSLDDYGNETEDDGKEGTARVETILPDNLKRALDKARQNIKSALQLENLSCGS